VYVGHACMNVSSAKTDQSIEMPFEAGRRHLGVGPRNQGTYGRYLANTVERSETATIRDVATIRSTV